MIYKNKSVAITVLIAIFILVYPNYASAKESLEFTFQGIAGYAFGAFLVGKIGAA